MNSMHNWAETPLPPSVRKKIEGTKGWLAPDEARLLYNIAKHADAGAIVEVGSYHGRSTVALSCGAEAGAKLPVYAIEPHEHFIGELGGNFGPPDRAAFFETMLRTS